MGRPPRVKSENPGSRGRGRLVNPFFTPGTRRRMPTLPIPPRSPEVDALLAWLDSRQDYERTPPRSPGTAFGLGRMRRLLALLGNPHHGLPVVHVAGTKGKGST
ncbi:MAG: hypothetical protein RLZZ440_311, partial [Planctomycetota bacterium]